MLCDHPCIDLEPDVPTCTRCGPLQTSETPNTEKRTDMSNNIFKSITKTLSPSSTSADGKSAAQLARKYERGLQLVQQLEKGGKEQKSGKFWSFGPGKLVQVVCQAVKHGVTPEGIAVNAPSLAKAFPWANVSDALVEGAKQKEVDPQAVLVALGVGAEEPVAAPKLVVAATPAKKARKSRKSGTGRKRAGSTAGAGTPAEAGMLAAAADNKKAS